MDPKEKAKELVEKFQDITALKVTLDEETTIKEIINHAKQCALIHIREVIKTLVSIDEYLDTRTYSKYLEKFLELTEVEQELEKL